MTTIDLIDVRDLNATDLDELWALDLMLSRCSADTLRGRCQGSTPAIARRHIQAIPLQPRQITAAAWYGGDLIGVGSLLADTVPTPASGAELAVLIEDRWQRLGVGTTIARHLADVAAHGHLGQVHAQVSATNTGALRLLRRVFPHADLSSPRDGLITATAAATARAGGRP